jgi:hypothetical protein
MGKCSQNKTADKAIRIGNETRSTALTGNGGKLDSAVYPPLYPDLHLGETTIDRLRFYFATQSIKRTFGRGPSLSD